MQAYTRAMSRTDHTPSTTPHQAPTPLRKTTMTRLASHLLTLTTLLTIVLTITLPLAGLLTHPTPADHAPATPTHTTPTHTTHTPTTHTTPEETPRISKADKAAAHVDGCRQQPTTTDTLLARPSCRSGMPVTRDHMTQAPDTPHNNTSHTPTPAPMNEVPPAWSGHWGAAAHSPHHHSQA